MTKSALHILADLQNATDEDRATAYKALNSAVIADTKKSMDRAGKWFLAYIAFGIVAITISIITHWF